MTKCIVLALIFIFISAPTAAQTNPFTLEFGKPYPIKTSKEWENKYGIPVELAFFKVPMDPGAKLPMFNDFSLYFLTEDLTVHGAQAERAYSDWESCESASQQAIAAAKSQIPDLKLSAPPVYSAKKLTLNLYCARVETEPFPMLHFSLSLPR